jgi:hypothetical protein
MEYLSTCAALQRGVGVYCTVSSGIRASKGTGARLHPRGRHTELAVKVPTSGVRNTSTATGTSKQATLLDESRAMCRAARRGIIDKVWQGMVWHKEVPCTYTSTKYFARAQSTVQYRLVRGFIRTYA